MSQPPPTVFAATTFQEPAKRRQPSSIPLRIVALCLTSVVTAVNYTNYGPLIPVLQTDLHINSGQAGLMSTLLFLGLAVAYIPAGALADRYGSRPVLIGSSILIAAGGMLLPLIPNFTWILFCRAIAGIGAGGTFVAGAGVAASIGKHSSLAQGLYGGSVQIGSGLGLLLTPFLYAWFSWRGAFLLWGILAISIVITWVFVNDGQVAHTPTKVDLKAGLRSPSVWTLGLAHMGTFGLGNAIAAWIAVYLAHQYGLTLGLAATLGSIALLTGMFFRPLGGILIGRGMIRAIPLLQMGTIMGFIGVALLALPLHVPLLVIAGMSLIAIGATIPYTSVFNEAARLRDVSKGIAQGLVSMISVPTVILGPPLIGFLFENTGNFTLAFGSLLIFSSVAVISSFLAGPAVKRETISNSLLTRR
ncbi:MAG TPA: MFS transporter [Ktedonobacteraceae bacterium]